MQEKLSLVNNPKNKFESILFLPNGENRKGEGGFRTNGYFKKSYNSKPLVTIITAVFNGEKHLKKTIQSVIAQTYDSIEYIVIDGGSTDGTVDIIKKYEDKIAYWISEADSGIYDAINKGLKLAMGVYVAILNADDYYEKEAIAASVECILKNGVDYSVANVQFVNGSNMIRPIFPFKKGCIYQEMPYPHVSAIVHARVYKAVGLFDASLKIAGDHDMALRIHLAGFHACYVNKIVARLEAGGVSNSTLSTRESLYVALKNGKSKPCAYATYAQQIAKIYIVRLLPKGMIKFLQKIKKSRFL